MRPWREQVRKCDRSDLLHLLPSPTSLDLCCLFIETCVHTISLYECALHGAVGPSGRTFLYMMHSNNDNKVL